MRRQATKKSADTSAEKKNRDTLIQSIAVEQSVLDDLRIQQTNVAFEIDSLEDKKEVLEKEISSLKITETATHKLLSSLREQVIIEQSKVSTLKDTREELLVKIADTKDSLKKIQDDHNLESVRVNQIRDKENDLYKKNIDTLQSIVVDLEAKIDLLTKSESQISKDIDSKQREQSSLDVSLAHRVEELARINRDLATSQFASQKAEREYRDIETKISNLKSDIAKKDEEIKIKSEELTLREEEVENKRKELVGVMNRERDLIKKTEAVRDLFQMAGLKVDF